MNASEDTTPDNNHLPAGSTDSPGRSPSLSSASLIGTRLGDYQILRKLGRGGMADVYAARHLSLGRDVAIKVLRSDFARDDSYVARFRREARAAAKLNHPNIVQVYDVGNVDDVHFITQELIDGKNLKELLQAKGSLTPEATVEVMVAVANALDAAAEVGITHRDIKPENVMQSTRGEIKVADFGLARLGVDGDASRANLTQAGLTMGTPRYMSPEQVQGKVADVRSDLYSLGVSMYHMLAGRPPFEADDPLALAVLHLHETPEPLDRARGNDDIPEWLVAVITRLMAKLPGDRYQSPGALLEAIGNETSVVSMTSTGTHAAIIKLQRATDAAAKRRRKIGKWVLAALLPLIAGTVAYGYASQQEELNVSELLRPETVNEADTVEEQFLIAVSRDDEPAWQAVGEYFPPDDNAYNRGYYAKSMWHLSELYFKQGRIKEADHTLRDLLNVKPEIDAKYRLVVLARRYALLQKRGGEGGELTQTRREYENVYTYNKDKPGVIEFFKAVVPDEERLAVEVGTAKQPEK